MANWWAPWTWFGEGRSHGDNFIRNVDLNTISKRHGVIVNEHTALHLTAVLCAVRVISEGIAQLPMKVYRQVEENGQTKRQIARDHPAFNVLHRRPNAWMTSFEWRELMTMHAVLLGDGYSIINRVNGKVDELIPVHPDYVTTEFDGSNVRYRITSNGKQAVYKREEVFHLRGPSMDGVISLPIVRLAAEAIGLAQSLEQTQTDLAANGGRPSAILTYDSADKLSPERRAEVAQSWREKFGPGGQGGTAVLEKAWSYLPMGLNAVDSQHIESRKMQIEEIGRAFRVLPIMMMHSDKTATYASAEQMFLAHVIHTLGPWVERWEHAVDRDLLDADEGQNDAYSHLEVNGLMRGSAKDRSEYFSRALGSGGSPAWLTQNEVRAREELDPVDGGDELFRPPAPSPGQSEPGAEDDQTPPDNPDEE
jgi:HK97 family phage portal protein